MKPCLTKVIKKSEVYYLYEDNDKTISFPTKKSLMSEIDTSKIKMQTKDLREVGKAHTSMRGMNLA